MKIYKFYGKEIGSYYEGFNSNKSLLIEAFRGQKIEKYWKANDSIGIYQKNKEDGETISILINKTTVKLENFESEVECVEVIVDAITSIPLIVRKVNCEYIKPEVLRLANEINERVYFEINDEKNKIDRSIQKEDIQEIIDRILLYGDSFINELKNLCNKFPIKIETVKADEKEDLIPSIRKVSIDNKNE